MKKVGVLGCGLMGWGIAEVCARAGYETVVREVDEAFLKKGLSRIDGSLARAVEKGQLKPEEKAAMQLSGTTKLEDLKDCDIIIEAIIENLELKQETYAPLDPICKPETIFCSNTYCLTITEMSI